MKRLATSQKSNTLHAISSSTSSATVKSTQPTGAQKQKSRLSAVTTPTIARIDERQSDISSDEAEEPVPNKKCRITAIHSYTEKISNTEYLCFTCNKVLVL